MRNVVVSVVAGLLLWPGGLVESQTAGSAPEAWRSSWSEFVQAVEKWRTAGNPVPTASFEGLVRGDPVPAELPVMKKFGGAVTFEGTFRMLGAFALMSGMTARIQIDLPPSKGKAADHAFEGMAHVYPAAGAISAWKAATAGSVVRFRAIVKGVAAMEPAAGRVAYIVLLQDAQLLAK